MNSDSAKTDSHFLELDGAASYEIKRVYSDGKRFTSISPIRTAGSRDATPDLLDLLGELSKGARDLFLEIKRNMDYRTHIAVLPNKHLSRSQINKRSGAIRELEEAGTGMAYRVPTSGIENTNDIEQRFRPSTFMLSPNYIYPGKKYKYEIMHIWHQCISKSKVRANKHPETPPTKTPDNSQFSILGHQYQKPIKQKGWAKTSLFEK